MEEEHSNASVSVFSDDSRSLQVPVEQIDG
jgi:hypothetical protein